MNFSHLDPGSGAPLRKKVNKSTSELENVERIQNGSSVRTEPETSTVQSLQTQLSISAAPASHGNPADSQTPRPISKPPLQRPQLKRPTFNAVLVNGCQRGNPILQHIRNVAWEYGDIVPDYQVGASHCILFLSLRYHRLHPEYIHTRINALGQMYTLRVLLVMCDVDHHQEPIKELTKIGMVHNLTMIVAWTPAEAGRYIESYKALEHKPPDLIRERPETDYISLLTQALTSIRGVNKTDVMTLISNFGSLRKIAETVRDRPAEIAMCPGFGDLKSKRLIEAFESPLLTRHGKRRRPQVGED